MSSIKFEFNLQEGFIPQKKIRDILVNISNGYSYKQILSNNYDPQLTESKQGFIYEAICKWCINTCLLYTSPSPRDAHESRMPSSA